MITNINLLIYKVTYNIEKTLQLKTTAFIFIDFYYLKENFEMRLSIDMV